WDINNLSLVGYRMLILPGGYAYDYKVALNNNGNQHIRDFVANGGAYVGVSAGAFYASDVIVWQGERFDHPLNLFDGVTDGEIVEIAPWPDYAITLIDIEPNVEHVTDNQPATEDVLFFGEGMMQPSSDSTQTVRVFASWRVPGTRYDGQPAIIGFDYGTSRALLIGTHLEIEENDGRDSNDVGSSLSDYGSDWPLLSRMMDWVEQQTEFTNLPLGEPAPDICGPVITLAAPPSPVTAGTPVLFNAELTDAEMLVKDASLTLVGSQGPFSVALSNHDRLHDEGVEAGRIAPPWQADPHWSVTADAPWLHCRNKFRPTGTWGIS
ncbi:MAG: BPL-N domain-containing protein, partial [Motiliproteus sp.]